MRVKLEDAHAVLERISRMESPSTVLSLAQVAQQLIDDEQRMLSPEERAMPLHIRRQHPPGAHARCPTGELL
jgi:hypothetical protein